MRIIRCDVANCKKEKKDNEGVTFDNWGYRELKDLCPKCFKAYEAIEKTLREGLENEWVEFWKGK